MHPNLDRDSLPIRLRRWRIAALSLALTIGLLAAAVAVAAADPGWGSTLPTELSGSPADRGQQPALAAGSPGRLVVAWSDCQLGEDPQAPNIYTARSTDGGRTWSAPQVLAQTGTDSESRLPGAVMIGERAFVVWRDQITSTHVVTIYEAEVGSGELHSVSLPFLSANYAATWPSLAASGDDRLHLAFNAGDETYPDILYASRWLTEATWPMAQVVYTDSAENSSWYPALAVDPAGGALHLVWEERPEVGGGVVGRGVIMYMSGTVGSSQVSWSPAITLSGSITHSRYPDIAVDVDGDLHVTWAEVIGPGQAYDQDQYVRYLRYDAAAGSWDTPSVRIDSDAMHVNEKYPTYLAPSIAVQEKGGQTVVCVAWHGFRQEGDVEEVLLSCSEDGGQTWPAPQNVSRSPGTRPQDTDLSINPAIAFEPGEQTLRVVWEEHNGSTVPDPVSEIYYALELDHQLFLPLVMKDW